MPSRASGGFRAEGLGVRRRRARPYASRTRSTRAWQTLGRSDEGTPLASCPEEREAAVPRSAAHSARRESARPSCSAAAAATSSSFERHLSGAQGRHRCSERPGSQGPKSPRRIGTPAFRISPTACSVGRLIAAPPPHVCLASTRAPLALRRRSASVAKRPRRQGAAVTATGASWPPLRDRRGKAVNRHRQAGDLGCTFREP